VSASSDLTIRIWNSETGDMVLGFEWSYKLGAERCVLSRRKRIVSASHDATIRIWNSETGEMMLGPLKGHTDFVLSTFFS